MGDLGQRIWQARKDGGVLERADVADVQSLDDAYRVQADAVAASGMTRSGWKIGATSQVAQDMLGVDRPAMGPVFAEMTLESPCAAAVVEAHGTAIECELAFVLKGPVANGEACTIDDIKDAIDYALPTIEIVGCRFSGGFKGAGTAVTISDFTFNAALVRGPELTDWQDTVFKDVAVTAFVNGEKVAEGSGNAVLGCPMEALRWAAQETARIGMPLKAGDIVSTGTMTGVTPVKAGDKVKADYGPLGTVEVSF